MDILEAHLAATCNDLGHLDQDKKYLIDGNTLETVKELIRFLRRDDETHFTRRYLGKAQVLVKDLLPILKTYWKNETLFDVVLRLMVNLTNPALLLYREEIPTEKTARYHYLELIGHLQRYKEAFTDNDVWAALSARLGKTLEIEWQERGEEESLVIERILILVRNILQVPADTEVEKRPDNDASIHDQVLWSLHQSGMVDILLYIATSENEHSYYMHVLEITSLMLREQTASSLASAALNRTQTEKERDDTELLAIRLKENEERRRKLKIFNGARHSRFGGTYIVKNLKSISNNDLIFHKPLNKLDSLNFDMNKSKAKTPKNRLPVRDNQVERRSAYSIRVFLKEFCVEFLNGAYNTIMYNVKDAIVRARAQAHDESYYLWAMRFFMEFNRSYKFEVKLVSETMSTQTFHFVQQQIETYYDMMSTDKKKLLLWSRRLHLGLGAYRELLLSVIAMTKSDDKEVRNSAKVIQSNIFYVLEYREILLTMMLSYDELKMSRSYLNDLIETQHIFVKMLEAFCGGKESSFVVQRKVKAQRKKKKRSNKSNIAPTVSPPNLDEQWDEVSPQLSAVLETDPSISSDIIPFDAASDISIDDQKTQAMCKIQTLLRQHEYENAIGFLRASREVWPENDCFGSPNMAPEDELLALKEIFYAEIQDEPPKEIVAPENEESEEESDNEEEEEGTRRIAEADFKFSDFINRFTHPKVVRACGLALRNFELNSDHTNHCIVKLLHRISWDCKMSAMLFQASLFRTFQRVFRAAHMTRLKEISKFAIFIIGKFVEVAKKNKKIYMELLFWKNSREAFDLEEGYGSYSERGGAHKGAWTELEEDELRRLFVEHKEQNIEKDVVDWICENLIDHTRTRRAVLKKLKELYLLVDYKNKASKGSKRAPKEWSMEEETQLQELMEEYRYSDDPIGNIMKRLSVHRAKARVIEKLLSMGLIQDRGEVRKKRARKSQGDNFRENSDTSELSSDESDDESRKPRTPKARPKPKKASIDVTAIKAVLDIIEKGLSGPLKWLHESVSDAADDLEDEANDDGVPLVPITTDEMDAMENPSFLHLLRSLGISEPFDEQESYWRIPGHFSVEDLRKISKVVTEGLEGTLQLPSEDAPEAKNADESSDDDVFAQVKKFVHKSDEEPSSSYQSPKYKKTKPISNDLVLETEDLLSLDEPNRNRSPISNINNTDSENEMALSSSSRPKNSKTGKLRKKVRKVSNSDLSDSEVESKSVKSMSSVSSIRSNNSRNSVTKTQSPRKRNNSISIQESEPSTSQNRVSSIDQFLADSEESDSELLTLGPSKKTVSNMETEIPKTAQRKSRIVRQMSDSENEDPDNEAGLEVEEPSATNGHTSLVLESDSDDEVSGKRSRFNSSDTENDRGKVKRPKMIISDDED